WHPDRPLLFEPRRRPQAARRRLHLAHQNDDRPGDFLHRGARDRLDARPQEGRPGRRQDAVLFRVGVDGGAGTRAPGRRTSAAGQRLQHRSGHARSQRGRRLRPSRQAGGHRRSPAGDHPRHLPRRLRQRRPAAGPAGLDPHRLCHFAPGRSGRAHQRRHRRHGQDLLRHDPDHRARGADRRVRRHGLYRGAYGVVSLVNLLELIATFYLTSILFVLVVLGTIARFAGFSILRFIAYIKDELLIVLGTSSSETVLPHMIQKMERLGASKSVVGLVIPTGYSFNLDGTNIYMTLATLFLAQATNTPLSIGQELGILAIAMITSKGASGVTGAGFVTLAATLAIV